MSDTASLSPSERFNGLIEGLFNDVQTAATNPWARLLPSQLMVIKVIWRRLRRMSRRFHAIMAQYRAGTLPEVGGAPRSASARPAGSPRAQRLSQRFGWVIYAVSWFVWGRHYDLEEMFEIPETAEMIGDAPEFGRVFRPLCQMLHVKPPAWLRLPRKARKPRPSRAIKHPPAPDFMVNDPQAILRRDGSVWMHFGSSTHWKPGCGETLEEARRYDPPQRIWPRRE